MANTPTNPELYARVSQKQSESLKFILLLMLMLGWLELTKNVVEVIVKLNHAFNKKTKTTRQNW